jgi:hypothetical protein
MAETKDPVEFCSALPGMVPNLTPGELPSVQADVTVQVRMPFGLPTIAAPDISCQGLSVVAGNLSASLTAVYPIIKLADSLNTVISAVQAIPGAIAGNVQPLTDALGKLPDIVTLLASFSGAEPAIYVKFVYDLCGLLIKTLTCLSETLSISIERGQKLEALRASSDLKLQALSDCFEVQNEALTKTMEAQFNSMQAIIVLMNTIIKALPPVYAIVGDISPGSNNFSPEAVAELISILEGVRTVLEPIAG